MLLIESDAGRRERLAGALRRVGISVVAVACIAEIERWPSGDIVVTDSRHFTPFWHRVGATHIVVLSDTPAEGIQACDRGATAWLPRACTPNALLSTLQNLLLWPPIDRMIEAPRGHVA